GPLTTALCGLPLDRQDFPTWAVFGVATLSWNGSVCPSPRPPAPARQPPARLFSKPSSIQHSNQSNTTVAARGLGWRGCSGAPRGGGMGGGGGGQGGRLT